ncbi:MAG: sugar nucleotide-binding protein [Clostridia bacterium]|nr:sugar nucleotide-binding protein [Clostridia bacterium]
MPLKILIFGAGGFVGRNLARVAAHNGWQVFAADSVAIDSSEFTGAFVADITDPEGADGLIAEIQPDDVVDLAAVADIDKAERNRGLTARVNVEGAANLARSCAAHGCRFLYFSSDAVFSGRDAGYSEEDATGPVNYYGLTKAQAEAAILAANPQSVVIRISLVLGFAVANGNSFLSGLKAKLSAGETVFCPTDEIRTPIDVLTLSECVLRLLENECSGVFHIGATGSIDRYQLTRKAAILMGFDPQQVMIQTMAAGPQGRAPRHRNGIIRVEKVQALLKIKLPDVDATLSRAVFETPARID